MLRRAALLSQRASCLTSTKNQICQNGVYALQVRNKWSPISEEKREQAREDLLEQFQDQDIYFNDDDDEEYTLGSLPDFGLRKTMETFEEKGSETTFQEDKSIDTAELEYKNRGFIMRVISIDPVQKVITQGKLLRFRALVVVGNEKGAAGFAVAKAKSVPDAVQSAKRLAFKNLVHVDLFDHRTLYHEVKGKFNSCRLFIKPTRSGRGTRAGRITEAILTCFGIEDVTSKCHGQRNPSTLVQAVFNAISKHRSADDAGMMTGQSIVEIKRIAKMRNL